jgi:ferric-dicitrate binding protein FerR (iron transport regulator)
MNDDLQPDEKDLRLARDIGELAENGNAASRGSASADPFAHALAVYREAYVREGRSPSSAEKNWARVVEETMPTRRQTPIFRLPVLRYAAAAAVILAAVALSFYLRPAPEWQLVASSGEAIEIVETGDGSRLILRPNSRLLAGREARHYRLEGEVHATVVHAPDRPFRIETEAGTVVVLGTRFIARTWDTGLDVYLEEGRVRLETARDTLELAPGEKGEARAGDLRRIESPTHVSLASAWLDGQIVLSERSLASVARELAHHYAVTIAGYFPDEVTLSGRLLLDDVNTTLANVAAVAGGRFEKRGPAQYVYVADHP